MLHLSICWNLRTVLEKMHTINDKKQLPTSDGHHVKSLCLNQMEFWL